MTERTKRERIRRLRERLAQAKIENPDDPLCGIVAGVLDLLEDDTRPRTMAGGFNAE